METITLNVKVAGAGAVALSAVTIYFAAKANRLELENRKLNQINTYWCKWIEKITNNHMCEDDLRSLQKDLNEELLFLDIIQHL